MHFWLRNMPIKTDKDEARNCMDILLQLIEAHKLDLKNPDVFLSVVSSIVEWWSGKAASRELKGRLKQVIVWMKSNGYDQDLLNYYQNTDEKGKEKINTMMSSQ